MRPFRRTLIVDPHTIPQTDRGEYSDVAVQVSSAGELTDYLGMTEGRWCISYHSTTLSLERKGQALDEFSFLCRAAWNLGVVRFIVEETNWFCDPHRIPLDFERLCKFGGHPAVELVCVSQAPADIHAVVRSETSELFCCTLQDPNHLDWFAKAERRVAPEVIQALPPHECLWFDWVDRSRPPRRLSTRLAGIDGPGLEEAGEDTTGAGEVRR